MRHQRVGSIPEIVAPTQAVLGVLPLTRQTGSVSKPDSLVENDSTRFPTQTCCKGSFDRWGRSISLFIDDDQVDDGAHQSASFAKLSHTNTKKMKMMQNDRRV